MQMQSQPSRLTGFPRGEYVARFPRMVILSRVGTRERFYDSLRRTMREIGKGEPRLESCRKVTENRSGYFRID